MTATTETVVPVADVPECKCAEPRPTFAGVHKKDEDPGASRNVITICLKCRGWLPPSYGDRSITVLEHLRRTLPALADGSRVIRQVGLFRVAFIRRDAEWHYDGAR